MDVSFIDIKNCDVISAVDMSDCLPKYEIKIKNLDTDKMDTVRISSPSLIKQMTELRDGKRDRCYFTFGFADIDIYRQDNMYVISNSPHEYAYIDYFITEDNFSKIIYMLQ